MVSITKAEKAQLLEHFPQMTFVRTMKQKSKRGHYYCVETPAVMRYLKKIRSGDVKQSDRRGDKK